MIFFWIALGILMGFDSHLSENILTEHLYALISFISFVAARFEYLINRM